MLKKKLEELLEGSEADVKELEESLLEKGELIKQLKKDKETADSAAKSLNEALKSSSQKLHDIKTIIGAYSKTETFTEDVVIGSFHGQDTIESRVVESPNAKLFEILLDLCEDKTSRGRSSLSAFAH